LSLASRACTEAWKLGLHTDVKVGSKFKWCCCCYK
jgi:hypothetical protein